MNSKTKNIRRTNIGTSYIYYQKMYFINAISNANPI